MPKPTTKDTIKITSAPPHTSGVLNDGLNKSATPKKTTDYAAYVGAAALPFALVSAFLGDQVGQLDVLGLYVLAMGLMLVLFYLERALWVQSGAVPLSGVAKLTRDADTIPLYRILAWVSVGAWFALSALLIKQGAIAVSGFLPLPWFILSFLLGGVALFASVLGARVVFMALVLLLAGALGNAYSGHFAPLTLTPTHLGEWAKALTLGVGTGAGLGLYWTAAQGEGAQTLPLRRHGLRLWGVALGSGVVAFLLLPMGAWLSLWLGLGQVLLSAWLLMLAGKNLRARLGWFGLPALLIVPFLASLPASFLLGASIVFLLLSALLWAIFAGYVMKMGHLRRALSFQSEGRYLFWRVSVRIGVPLAIMLAIMGYVI